MRYLAVLHKDTGSDYGVIIPDLPGCFSSGVSVAEALKNAVEAVECHVQGLSVDSEEIPLPVGIELHRADLSLNDGIWAFIDVDLSN